MKRSAVFYCFVFVMIGCGHLITVPPPHDTRYEAMCECQVCTAFDPQTGACTAMMPKDDPLFDCSLQSADVDENALENEFRSECTLGIMPPSIMSCDLIPLDGNTCPSNKCSPFVVLQDMDHNCVTTSRVVPSIASSSWSGATIESGTIQISSSQGDGTTSLQGSIEFIGGNCVTGTCPFEIVDTSLAGPSFDLAGNAIEHPFVFNTTEGDGFLFGDAGIFMINAQGLEILATATVSGDRTGVTASSDTAGVGLINQHARQLVFAQSFVSGDATLQIQLAAAINNLLPTVSLPATPEFECNAPGGANVALTAAMADADGQVASSRWSVDGRFVAANTSTIHTFMSLGTHVVHVDVVDNDGGPASAETTVSVADTTPPTLGIDSFCLWPPNHDLYVVDPSMLHVSDACDPNPSITFISGASNQPDNGLGDGNTTGDLVVQHESVCARAERDGMLFDGRVYTIAATVVDAAGNKADVSFAIDVLHDKSRKCDQSGGVSVADTDPRCVPVSSAESDVVVIGDEIAKKPASAPDGGCSAGHDVGSSFAVLVICLFVVMRRRRWRLGTLTVVLATHGCVVPPNLQVAAPDTRYKAECECQICTAFDPQTGLCTAFTPKFNFLYACDVSSDLVDETVLENELRMECMLSDMPPSEMCDLVVVDSSTGCPSGKCSQYVEEQAGDHNCTNSSRVSPTTGSRFWSNAVVESGTMQISSPQGDGTASLSGSLEFSGANCATGACSFDMVDVSLSAPAFDIAGSTVHTPFVMNTTEGTGSLFADAGIFMIDAQSLQVVATGEVEGDHRGVASSADTAGVGLINQHARQLVFAQSFPAGDVTVEIQVAAAIDNLLPTVRLTAQEFECNAAGGANVTLSATLADTDGIVTASRWYVDGAFVATNTSSVHTFLSLGSHTVHIDAVDNDGGPGSLDTTVVVKDTTGPTLSIDSFCLWPPNHDLYVIDPSMVKVIDACDPAPSITFIQGTSNQPDNGTGDGDTTNDLVVQPGSVCARAERDGMLLDGRVYTIAAQATDASGNVSDLSFTIDVLHDRSRKCDENGGQPVEAGDGRCVPSSQTMAQSEDITLGEERIPRPVAPLSSGGCDASQRDGAPLGVFLVLGVYGLRRRRRS